MHGLFELTIFYLNDRNTDQLKLGIYQNELLACRSAAADSTNGAYHFGGCSAALELNTGDIVDIRCDNAGTVHGSYYSGFTGHLVHLM